MQQVHVTRRVGREELTASDIVARINGELQQYPVAAGCVVRSVRRVAVRSRSDCNWTVDQFVTTATTTNHSCLSIVARVIHDFQECYALMEMPDS